MIPEIRALVPVVFVLFGAAAFGAALVAFAIAAACGPPRRGRVVSVALALLGVSGALGAASFWSARALFG